MQDLEDAIQAEIARRNLKPRPLIYFLGKRSVFWAMAVLSVVLGSISAASTLFLALDYYRTGGRELDEIPFDDLAAYAPFVWFALLALFAICAQFSFKGTRDGYRYKPAHVIAGALVLSTLLGALLYSADVGGVAHRYLTSHLRAYAEYTTIPYDYWSRSAEGYLAGEVLGEGAKEITIRDFKGAVWKIDTTSAVSTLTKSATEEGDIAIRGHVTGELQFKADSIGAFD